MPNRRYRRRTEYRFQSRILSKLRREGWICLNCSRFELFDLVAVKDHYAVILEVKSRVTDYPDDQRNHQQAVAIQTGNGYVLLQQLYERNQYGFKVALEPFQLPIIPFQMLQHSLSNFL